MTRIAIYVDTSEVDKLAAAEALSKVNGPTVHVYELDAGSGAGRDRIVSHVDVFARRKAFEGVDAPQVNWGALGSVSASTARQYAEMITLAAELVELAEMLAAR